MRFKRRSKKLLTGLVSVTATALVGTTLAVAAGTSSAAASALTLEYSCPFPLIGNQDVSVEIATELPATIATGAYSPAIKINAVSNAGETATQGLRLVDAETIDGSALATSTVKAPQGNLAVQVPSEIPNQPIPAVGNDLVLNASGSAPGLRFDQPGSATLTVNDLVLKMTPRKADGSPTELGTFESKCTQKDGQNNVLHTFEVTGDAVTPESPTGPGSKPLKQLYKCPFPLIGVQDVSVEINTELPGTVVAGEFTPPIAVKAISNAGQTATQGLRLVGATTIEGSALATSLVKGPQGHLGVRMPTAIPRQPIPATGNDLILNAEGTAPALRFDEPGEATVSVHDLVLEMTPRRADGTPTDLGTFTSDCTLQDGQDNVLHKFTVEGGEQPDTEPPTSPGNVSVGDTTADSIALNWDASTDNVGVTGYDVLVNGTKAASTTETSATIGDLQPDTEYTLTVVANDAAGNIAKSAPVTAKTEAEDPGEIVERSYGLSGSSYIKAADGRVSLSGGIDAALNLATGEYQADLLLKPTTGNFPIFGFIPATARIAFEPQGKTIGSLTGDGKLTSHSAVTIKLPRVSVVGFPVSTSSACQTVEPAQIDLASSGLFDPLAGGALAGSYTIPKLTGCGKYTSWISAFTAGPGNTVTIKLAAKEN